MREAASSPDDVQCLPNRVATTRCTFWSCGKGTCLHEVLAGSLLSTMLASHVQRFIRMCCPRHLSSHNICPLGRGSEEASSTAGLYSRRHMCANRIWVATTRSTKLVSSPVFDTVAVLSIVLGITTCMLLDHSQIVGILLIRFILFLPSSWQVATGL